MASDDFADLMARLRAGDEDAAARVFFRFAHRLIALARLHIDSRARRKVDPEDVLQSDEGLGGECGEVPPARRRMGESTLTTDSDTGWRCGGSRDEGERDRGGSPVRRGKGSVAS